MYKPFFKLILLVFISFIICSCTLRSASIEEIFIKQEDQSKTIKKAEQEEDQNKTIKKAEQKIDKKINQNLIQQNSVNTDFNSKVIQEVEIILPADKNLEITNNFINSLELSIHKKNVDNLSININTYYQKKDLHQIIQSKIQPGKIFIGPLTSNDTKDINSYCAFGVIFLSFASDRRLASDCVYLINFFPEDDLRTLFKYFDYNARVALLYPENYYGNYINNIIDSISADSESILINKSSYDEDMNNARDAIKKLGKYEARRAELERQKKILQNKDDEISKKALKKIEKFETIGELDFTHVIIADHNIRLLKIVPLLPFYDIDPNKIQFVGTGVWDNPAFFDEPSLQRAIFPGVARDKRIEFIEEYTNIYGYEPIRTATIMYDLIGLLEYIIEEELTIESSFALFNDKNLSFEGIDGKFFFENNLIRRDLNVLQIKNGTAVLVR